MTRTILAILLLVLTPVLSSCSDGPSHARTSPPSTAESTPLPTGHPAIDAVTSEAATHPSLERGAVLEVIQAGSYTYLLVESGDTQVWVAGSRLAAEIGQEVVWGSAMPMKGWHSETLDRTWEEVLFVGHLALADGVPTEHPNLPASGSEALPSSDDVEVAPLADGLRVAEVWARGGAIAGESVALRGRVVTANFGILGSNWYHVQDGSGDPVTETHDLTVRSLDKANVGDVIVIRGRLVADRDFGAGYRYDLIVEDAHLSQE